MYQKVKGTQDFFDDNARKFRYLEKVITKVITKFGYEEIITPIFEHTEVFVRSSGEESDIVSKEMYTFKDKGDRSLTLRPEGTAGVVRSFIENKMYANASLKKLYYLGSMFRYERPQAGRFRQFYQFGVEAFGPSSPFLDVDVIISAWEIFKALGIENIQLQINSIGDFPSRTAYAAVLKEHFAEQLPTLCPDCQRRYAKNPLRILDCKADSGHPAIKKAPRIGECLSVEARAYFQNVLKILDASGIPYQVNENLVRGLDYYTDTVFEFIYTGEDEFRNLALGAGGKYAGLVASFGGPDLPGIGYGIGVDRIMAIMEKQKLFPDLLERPALVLLSLDEESKIYALNIARLLRQAGYAAELDYLNYNLKPQFKLVERLNPAFIAIIGEEERLSRKLTVKNNQTKTQTSVREEELLAYLKENLYENA
jgi:histidyl-tRNA synthetase